MSLSNDNTFERNFFDINFYKRPEPSPAQLELEIRSLKRRQENSWKEGPHSFYFFRAIVEAEREFKKIAGGEFNG